MLIPENDLVHSISQFSPLSIPYSFTSFFFIFFHLFVIFIHLPFLYFPRLLSSFRYTILWYYSLSRRNASFPSFQFSFVHSFRHSFLSLILSSHFFFFSLFFLFFNSFPFLPSFLFLSFILPPIIFPSFNSLFHPSVRYIFPFIFLSFLLYIFFVFNVFYFYSKYGVFFQTKWCDT